MTKNDVLITRLKELNEILLDYKKCQQALHEIKQELSNTCEESYGGIIVCGKPIFKDFFKKGCTSICEGLMDNSVMQGLRQEIADVQHQLAELQA